MHSSLDDVCVLIPEVEYVESPSGLIADAVLQDTYVFPQAPQPLASSYESAGDDININEDEEDVQDLMEGNLEIADDLSVLSGDSHEYSDDNNMQQVAVDELVDNKINLFDEIKKVLKETPVGPTMQNVHIAGSGVSLNEWDMTYSHVPGVGYQGRNYQPFRNYTMLAMIIMKYVVNLSDADTDLLIQLLKHPDFDVKDLPYGHKDIQEQRKLIPGPKLNKASDGHTAYVDQREIVQHHILASPIWSHTLRYNPVSIQPVEYRDTYNLYSMYSYMRSAKDWNDKHPTVLVACGPDRIVGDVESSSFCNIQFCIGDIIEYRIHYEETEENGVYEHVAKHVGVIAELWYTGYEEEDMELSESYDIRKRQTIAAIYPFYVEPTNTNRDKDITYISFKTKGDLQTMQVDHIDIVPNLYKSKPNIWNDKVKLDGALCDADQHKPYEVKDPFSLNVVLTLRKKYREEIRKPLPICLGLFKDATMTCPFTMDGQMAGYIKVHNAPMYMNSTPPGNHLFYSYDMNRTRTPSEKEKQKNEEFTNFVKNYMIACYKPVKLFNFSKKSVQTYQLEPFTVSVDLPEALDMTNSKKNYCPICRPAETYELAHINHQPIFEPELGILREGHVIKTIEDEIKLYDKTRDKNNEDYVPEDRAKNRMRSVENAIFEYDKLNDNKFDIFSNLNMENMHNLLLALSGRLIKTVQKMIISQRLNDHMAVLYRIFSAKDNISIYCPLLRKQNNAVVLTGRMKANNVDQYLQVIHIIYCYVFKDQAAVDWKPSLYTTSVQQSEIVKTVEGRLSLMNAIRDATDSTVGIVRLLQRSSIDYGHLETISKLFDVLEESAAIIDQVLPDMKDCPFKSFMMNGGDNCNNIDDVNTYDVTDGRFHYLAFDTYRMVRDHYRLFIERKGSLHSTDAKPGEQKNLTLRVNAKFSNHRGMSGQIMDRAVLTDTLLSLMTGSPYTMFAGEEISSWSVEQRLQYYTQSAEHEQLLVPGKKLLALLDVNRPDMNSAESNSNKLSNLLKNELSPSLLTPLSNRGLRPDSVVRDAGNRPVECTIGDIWNKYFKMESQQHILGKSTVNLRPKQSEEVHEKWMQSFLKISGYEKVNKSKDQGRLRFRNYKKLMSYTGTVLPGMHVACNGDNDEIWYAKILDIYAPCKSNNHIYQVDTSTEKRCVAICLYYQDTKTKNSYGYIKMKPHTIDVLALDQIISFAHLYDEDALNKSIRRMCSTNNKKKQIVYDAADTPLHSQTMILNKLSVFPRFW
jgi:hypothetical protein